VRRTHARKVAALVTFDNRVRLVAGRPLAGHQIGRVAAKKEPASQRNGVINRDDADDTDAALSLHRPTAPAPPQRPPGALTGFGAPS
jgi:hypothetical protein